MANMQQAIKNYILEEFAQDKADFAFDTNLIQEGIIDSLSVLMVISFVEKSFNVKIEPEDVVLENFQSVNAITSLVDKRAAA